MNFKFLLYLLPIFFLITACGGDNGTSISFDYSDAPAFPDTANAVSKVFSDTGLIYYVITEGDSSSFELTIRDDMFVYYTTRNLDGDIVSSSFVNGSTSPRRVNNVGLQTTIGFGGQGLIEGILGMKEGERRLLIIPDEINTTDQTITIDFELVSIAY